MSGEIINLNSVIAKCDCGRDFIIKVTGDDIHTCVCDAVFDRHGNYLFRTKLANKEPKKIKQRVTLIPIKKEERRAING